MIFFRRASFEVSHCEPPIELAAYHKGFKPLNEVALNNLTDIHKNPIFRTPRGGFSLFKG